jgi:hypothetical protein
LLFHASILESTYINLEGDTLEQMKKIIVRKWVLERINIGIQYERWFK